MQAELQTQLVVAAISSWLIQKVKSSPLVPFIHEESEKLNRYFAGLIAALGTVGIALACSWTDRTCTLRWPDGPTLALGLWAWAKQWVIMHGWFKVAKS